MHVKSLSVIDRGLVSIYLLSAIVFLILLPLAHPYPYSYVLKAVPVACLIVIALRSFNSIRRIFVLLALIFCVAGDILLDLDRSANFKLALAAFLIGHIFYIATFLQTVRLEKRRVPWLAGIAAYLIAVAFFLRNIPGDVIVPVMAYLVVIGFMAISSFLMADFSWLVSLGSLVFVASDTIIAVNKFLRPLPNSTLYNIGLYFAAQMLIILGLVAIEYRKSSAPG